MQLLPSLLTHTIISFLLSLVHGQACDEALVLNVPAGQSTNFTIPIPQQCQTAVLINSLDEVERVRPYEDSTCSRQATFDEENTNQTFSLQIGANTPGGKLRVAFVCEQEDMYCAVFNITPVDTISRVDSANITRLNALCRNSPDQTTSYDQANTLPLPPFSNRTSGLPTTLQTDNRISSLNPSDWRQMSAFSASETSANPMSTSPRESWTPSSTPEASGVEEESDPTITSNPGSGLTEQATNPPRSSAGYDSPAGGDVEKSNLPQASRASLISSTVNSAQTCTCGNP
ncbi:Hypothetical protein D9617_141g026560 [Elsinoe fawcettii]|nr:Hypothetical protein D9617_141g026560 [Elsinoe fawcettii]